ncbi:MAG: DedA family protein [Verrucomicrobiales bacterium]|nr:DedA family protein [Verrucomicrobiales bacterium]MCP5528306.1 DedA family protein [Verrucomicrobiales bacterium]
MMRRLYDWTLSWAERPGGAWALFFLAVAESSVFPIPPDVLLIALAVGVPKRAFRFAAICAVGSVLGGMIGYAIGAGAWHAVQGWFIPHLFSQAAFEKVQTLYQGNAFLAILTAAFTPIPYKVFTIAAGVFNVSFWTLVSASIVGRSMRFVLVAGIIYVFGPSVKSWIEKYFDWCAWGFLILLVLGFILVKYLH